MDSPINPFKHEFTIVIFIHYKSFAVDEDDLKRVTNEKNDIVIKQFHEHFCSKTPSLRSLFKNPGPRSLKIKSFFSLLF